ncbi:UNVERIFIED_CONTAM: hypothetical protein GTU68_027299 [Idotea baltica]|nr:hypothetical protein [Idotea baltica]
MYRHTGERPFACPVCPVRCTEKQNLRRHMAVHSGEKPFQCPRCSVKFKRNISLRNHISKMHLNTH